MRRVLVPVFAYGSNLSRKRIELRVGEVEVLGIARLTGHEFRFHKAGRDGSAKADAFETGRASDVVWGVVYGMTEAAKRELDRYEGLGRDYLEREAVVVGVDGKMSVRVYHAHPSRIVASVRPFDWYRDWVVLGARAHRLPEEYIERIARHPVVEDPDPVRAGRERGAQRE